MKRCLSVLVLLITCLAQTLPSLAAEAKLEKGDFVAVIGDSITEQQLYSLYIEDYLLMCKPAAGPAGHAVRLGRRDGPGLRRPHGQRHPPLLCRPWPRPATA